MSGEYTSPSTRARAPTDPPSTEFSQYLAHEKAKTIPIEPYNLDNSLRVWLIEFEQQAAVHGIDNLDSVASQLSKYLPVLIQRWIPTLTPSIRSNFSLLKEALLSRFAMAEEEENRFLLRQLKQCRKNPRESIRLHAAKWEHLLSLISTIYTEDTKISLFIQSLDQRDTRLTLTSLVAAMNITSLAEVIKQAINLEVRAKLLDTPELVDQKDDPMEIDAIRHGGRPRDNKKSYNNWKSNKWKKGNNNSGGTRRQQSTPQVPRLYNKKGEPVCGHCFQLHRTIDCEKQNYQKSYNNKHYSVNTMGVTHYSDAVGKVDLEEPITVVKTDTIVAQPSINHVNFKHINTPLSFLKIADLKIRALWDTGSAITCIATKVAERLKLPIDRVQTILYTDVNQNVNKTRGTVSLDVFNTSIQLHVIDDIAKEVIIGFDTMKKWKAVIDTEKSTVGLTIQNTHHSIAFTANYQQNSQRNEICTLSIQTQVEKLLVKYNSIIPEDNDKPSTTNLVEFTIDTGDAPPVYTPPRVYHPDIQRKIDEKLDKLAKNGIVTKVMFSEWGSNVTAVPKPNGDIRPCGNYVKLNAITNTIKYPFVHLHHALQSLGKSTIFSKIDLASGYYAIKIAEQDREKTALVTTNGTYVFNFMPFGLKNAPAVFQSLMDRVLGPLKYTTAIAYLDDVIIHSSSTEQHLRDLEHVLLRIQEANLSINRDKCAFGLTSVEFLGFIVSDKGISANPEKIQAILVIPAPTDIHEVERFLGVCGVYQKFISNFQVITEPLRRLKKKDTEFIWTDEQQHAFEKLRQRLAELPTLRQPDFSKPFELHCDAATSAGIGIILCQRDDEGAIYPISFSSRSLSKHEQKYAVRELEALAIVWGIKKHRVYLEAGHFTVYSDHSSLQWLLNTNQDKQPRLWRWCLFLQAYDFEVKYVAGHKNVVADMLSRNPLPQISAITAPGVAWTTDSWWITEQANDSMLSEIVKKLEQGEKTEKSYHMHKGILCKINKYKQQTTHHKVAPAHMVPTMIEHYHGSQFAGHGGTNKTYKALQSARIYFANMEKEVSKITKSCVLCQKIKGDKSKQFPMSSTSGYYPFQKIAIDYFGPLPSSLNNNKYILVVIDTFTRYVELYPMESTNSMELAKTFYYQFVLRHGMPELCLQDNGTSFASEFNQQLAKFSGMELVFTSPYVASSNGLVERFMKTLRQMILCYCRQDNIKTHWDVELRLIRFVYNNMYHSSLKTSPFELVHGRKARTPVCGTRQEEELIWPEQYREADTPQLHFAKELKTHLEKAFEVVYDEMNTYEDPKNYKCFQLGDKVMFFNMQLSNNNKPRKLAYDWFGPFVVKNVLSKTRYDIENIASKKLLKNMHVSLLKPFYESNLLL